MNQSFDNSNIDLDIDSLSEPMGFADGGEAEAMHLTPYVETNQDSMDNEGHQDSHSMPPMYAQGGDVEIGDYSIPTFRDRTASQMLQAFADGGAVQGRPVGGMFDLGVGNPADRGMSVGQSYAIAPGGIGQTQYNKNISDVVTANIHRSPQVIASETQKWGVSPGDITSALGGQTLESRFRQEPSYQQTTTASGQMKDLFGPATMLTGGTGTGANWVAPTVTSRPRTLVDVTPGLSASQQHARNLVQGDTALNDAFTRTGLAKDPATYYDWQQQMNSGAVTPDQLKSKFDPIAYERRVTEAYGNIGRQGMGNDLSSFHPTSMGEMFKAYMNPNATAEDVQRITDQYSGSYGTNWNADTANKARAEVIIPSLQAQDYYKRNSDVSAAFDAALKADPNQDYVGFAKNHYNKYGKKEGRTWNSDITVGKYKAPEAEDFAKIDPGGYNWWMNQLKEGKISGADFDKMFYGATATYAGPYKDLYKDSMDKANELIKARGLNIATGATQTLPGVTGYKYPNQNALVDSINALYQTNLSRDAEPGGMTFWLNQFGADGKISPEEATLFKQSAQAERTARKMAQGGYVGYADGGAVDLLKPAPNNLPSLQLPTLRDAQGNEYILQNGARYYKDSSGVPDPSMQGGSDEYVDPNPSWSGKTPTERAEYYQDPKNALMAAATQLGQKGFSFTSAGMLQNLLNPSIQPAEAAIARGETPQQTFRDSELAKQAEVNAAFAEQMAKDQVDADQGAAVGDGNTGSYTSDNGGSFSPSDAGYGVYARGGYVKKPEGAASYRMAAPVRLALGGSISRSPFRSQNEDSDYAKFMLQQQQRGAPTQFAEPPPAPKTVTDLYRDVLGRAPDEGGAAYWAERFGSEVDPEETALFTQAAQPEIAARAPAPEPAAPAYTGIFGGMGAIGRSSSIPNPAGYSIFSRYGIQPNATNTDGQVSGGGGGGDNAVDRLARFGINAALSHAIGPTYDFANAGRQVLQGNIPGAASSLVSGVTGGVSNVLKKFRFAEGGEVAEEPAPVQEPRPNSAADTLKKLGLSVARGAPQIVTGAVDLAALPFTATGMIKPEDVVLSTEYLTKKGLLPPPQKGVANETMELLSSAVNPAGAVKGSAAMALGMMKNATGKTLAKQLDLPFEQAAKGPAESPMIRAYTGHTREIVGPYDVDRASRSADMGPGLYLTDDAEYASRSATKRVGRGIPESDAAPAVYPVDIEKSKILMHDKQYPREVLDKLRKFSKKVEDTPGSTVSGEYIYEQIRKAEIPKTMMPSVFKLMGFQGAEFLPGGVSGGKSYVVYDTTDTAKGAYTKKKFKDGGEATADFIKKSSKRR